MFKDSSHAQLTAKHRAALAASMEMDVAAFERTETVVRSEQDRADSGLAVAYHVGSPTIIRCDPALADEVSTLAAVDRALSAREFEQWAGERGWQFIDGGDQHLVARSSLLARPLPSGIRLQELDREVSTDRARIEALLTRNDPEDVDEAEFEMDDLDPFILGLIADDGELRALVSGRVWDEDPDFDDIGVLTDESVRGQGWGSALVSAFCAASYDRGRVPLYRCNWSRTASKALALGLGFELVGQLSAVGPHSE